MGFSPNRRQLPNIRFGIWITRDTLYIRVQLIKQRELINDIVEIEKKKKYLHKQVKSHNKTRKKCKN